MSGAQAPGGGAPHRLLSRPVALLTAGAGALLEFLAVSREWVSAPLSADQAAGAGVAVRLAVTGRQTAPAALALVLAVLAATAATALGGARWCPLLGVLLLLAALAGAAVTWTTWRDPAGALASEAARVGAAPADVAAQVQRSAWVLVASLGWVLPAAAGAITVLVGRRWPGRRPAAGAPGRAERTASGAGATDRVGVWEALSRGEDPT